jgi:hypothetical protein
VLLIDLPGLLAQMKLGCELFVSALPKCLLDKLAGVAAFSSGKPLVSTFVSPFGDTMISIDFMRHLPR